MKNLKVVQINDLDLEKSEFVKGKINSRLIFFSHDKKFAYKIWDKNYLWANLTEQGFHSNYYDNKLVPNFYALIKDKEGCNRGYITRIVKSQQCLQNIEISLLIKIIGLIKKRISLRDELKYRYKFSKKSLTKLLFTIFSRAVKTKRMFTDIGVNNFWTDGDSYYLFDLESCREFDYIFNKNTTDPEYINQVRIRNNINKGLKTAIEKHELIFPMRINKEEDLVKFWGKFIIVNNINYTKSFI